jgi:WD40 repeat protein
VAISLKLEFQTKDQNMVNRFSFNFIGLFLIGIILVPFNTLAEQASFLVIESGMHHAPIWRIGADKNCQLIATASRDKTVRLWESPTEGVKHTSPTEKVKAPKLVHTLRATIGAGNEGKFRSVAVSPDGRLVAAGAAAWNPPGGGPWIYIFDAETGEIKVNLPLPAQPNDLVFSNKGDKLAVAFWGGLGYRIWDTKTWTSIGGQEYTRKPKAHSYGLAFDSDDRLYTVAYDKFLRRYTFDESLDEYTADIIKGELPLPLNGGKKPYALAVHPNGSMIAIAYNDKSSPIEVYLVDDFKRGPIYKAKGKNTNDVFLAVTWSPDGKRLYGGGKPKIEVGDDRKPKTYPLYYWEDENFGVPHKFDDLVTSAIPLTANSLESPGNSVIDLIPCGEQHVAFGAHDPAFYILDSNGKRLFGKEPTRMDMRGKLGNDFTVSEDGNRVRFNQTFGGVDNFVLFDLEKETLTPSPERPNDLFPAQVSGLDVGGRDDDDHLIKGDQGWNETYAPTLNKKKLNWKDKNEKSRSLAISPNKQNFVLGAEWSINLYDNKGTRIEREPGPSVVWGVNIAGNGKLVVAAYGDGTIRWRRLSDLTELLALYVYPHDPSRWIAWTPKGYYKASGGGELIGWHVNGERDQKAQFFEVGKYRREFNRPDIVQLVLQTLDEEAAITQANITANRPRASDGNEGKILPVIKIKNLKNGENLNNPEVTLEYEVSSPSSKMVTSIDVFVNGLLVETFMPVVGKFRHTVNICPAISGQDPKEVKVELIPFAKEQPGKSAMKELNWIGESGCIQGDSPGTLRAVLVGVNYKSNSQPDLHYADKDAEDLAAVLKSFKGSFYKDVIIKSIVNSDATTNNITKGLEELFLQSKRQGNKNDIFLFFFSGHGKNGLTDDFQLVSGGSGSLSEDIFIGILSRIKGRKIILLDACRSGQVNFSTLYNKIHDPAVIDGAVFIASSPGPNPQGKTTLSWECPYPPKKEGCQNGYFTHALLEGLRGEADHPQNGLILTRELQSWVVGKVPLLTEDQEPVTGNTPRIVHFPVGVNPIRRNIQLQQ